MFIVNIRKIQITLTGLMEQNAFPAISVDPHRRGHSFNRRYAIRKMIFHENVMLVIVRCFYWTV